MFEETFSFLSLEEEKIVKEALKKNESEICQIIKELKEIQDKHPNIQFVASIPIDNELVLEVSPQRLIDVFAMEEYEDQTTVIRLERLMQLEIVKQEEATQKDAEELTIVSGKEKVLENIQKLYLGYYNTNQDTREFAEEFFYAVGELLNGKSLRDLKLNHLKVDEL